MIDLRASVWKNLGPMSDGLGRALCDVFIYNGFLYMVGGQRNSVIYADIYGTQIHADGSLGQWKVYGQVPPSILPLAKIELARAVVYNDKLLIFGGDDGVVNNSKYCVGQINGDGSISDWSVFTFPITSGAIAPVILNGRVYALCTNGVVYVGQLNSDGSVGTWKLSLSIPAEGTTPTRYLSIVVNGKILVFRGNNTVGPLVNAWAGTVLPDGSVLRWDAISAPQAGHTRSMIAVLDDYIYLMGGHAAGLTGAATTSVEVAKINSDGSVGPWSPGPTLPIPICRTNAVVDKASHSIILAGGGPDQSNANYTTNCFVIRP